jgi:hypothetical protein
MRRSTASGADRPSDISLSFAYGGDGGRERDGSRVFSSVNPINAQHANTGERSARTRGIAALSADEDDDD